MIHSVRFTAVLDTNDLSGNIRDFFSGLPTMICIHCNGVIIF